MGKGNGTLLIIGLTYLLRVTPNLVVPCRFPLRKGDVMQERMICEIILALMAVTYFAGATYIYKKVSDMLEEIKALAMRGDKRERP